MPDHPLDAAPTSACASDPIANMRLQLCDLLPRAMHNAIRSYQQFSAQASPDDAKQFTAHHTACRSALAHLDALSKLGKWLVAHHPQTPARDNLQPLLQEARRVLTQLDTSCEGDADEPGETEF